MVQDFAAHVMLIAPTTVSSADASSVDGRSHTGGQNWCVLQIRKQTALVLEHIDISHAPPLLAKQVLAPRGAPLCDWLRLFSGLQDMEWFTGKVYSQTADHIERHAQLQSALPASVIRVLDTSVDPAASSLRQLSVEQRKRLQSDAIIQSRRLCNV